MSHRLAKGRRLVRQSILVLCPQHGHLRGRNLHGQFTPAVLQFGTHRSSSPFAPLAGVRDISHYLTRYTRDLYPEQVNQNLGHHDRPDHSSPPRRRRSTRRSAARKQRAHMVRVGLTPGQVGKTAPLKTYSPGASCTRKSGFTTEEAGSSPMRHPPRSWLLQTPRKRGPRHVVSAPIA